MKIKNKKNYILCFILAGILFLQTAEINAQDRPSRAQGTGSHPGVNLIGATPAGSILINRVDTIQPKSPEWLIKNIFLNNDASASVTIIRIAADGWQTQYGNNGWAAANIYNNPRGLAYFSKGGSNFPMAEGLLMCTGNTLEAEGINYTNSGLAIDYNKKLGEGDADLLTLVDKQMYYNEGYTDNTIINNAAILEFDFIPSAYSMQFEYIFASEEYPKYVNTKYNDVFGFWVEDRSPNPTIPKQNIARLPNGDIVSINTVNNGTWNGFEYTTRPLSLNYNGLIYTDTISHNKEYFIKNIKNSETTEFNGYTTVLKAAVKGLNPSHTYRLKLAVANTGDSGFGSGVFLKANSLIFGNTLSVYTCGVKDGDTAYKKAENNFLRISRPDIEKDEERNVVVEYGGTAVNGVDYTTIDGEPLPDTILFPIGVDYVDVLFTIPEGATVGRHIEIKLAPLYAGATPTVHTVNIAIATVNIYAGGEIRQGNSNEFTMNGSPTNNGTWSVVGDADGVLIANPTLYNTKVTLDLSKRQSATLRWTVIDGHCTFHDDVELKYGKIYLPVNPGSFFYKK
jgi:hypothetical protein